MKYLLNKTISAVAIATLIVGFGAYAATQSFAQEDGDPICEMISAEIVSNSDTMVNSTSSVAVDNDAGTEGNQVPAAWTADIAGATWIWSDAQNDGAAATGTEVFSREFNWSSDATTTAMLDIASDNTYSVSINGVPVASSSDEVNFTLLTQDSYDVSGMLVDGTNTLEISVTNLDNGGDNPAGLLYSLDIDGFDCEDPAPEPEQPTGEILEPDSGETVSGVVELLAVYDDGDSVNDDSVQWAVREGTCAAGTDTVFGNVDGHSDLFDWDGADFSASIDTELVSDGEYCFIFNPTDDAGEENVRLTQNFIIDNDDEDGDDEDREDKMTVCHIPPGNPANMKTLHIDADDLDDHLGHGDVEGSCEDVDLEFEFEAQINSDSDNGNNGRGNR